MTEASLDLLKEKLKPEDVAFFITVAKAIGDKSALRELESIERWRVIAEVGLDASWETITEI